MDSRAVCDEKDYGAFLAIVVNNLTKNICPKTQKIGCFGQCPDCGKKRIADKVASHSASFSVFGAQEKVIDIDFPDEDEVVEIKPPSEQIIGGMTQKQRISYWNAFYESKGIVSDEARLKFLEEHFAGIDFGDSWDDYGIVDPVNEQGDFGYTPLHRAILDGNIDQVEDLLAEGADPYIRTNGGHTALAFARLEGQNEIVELLLLLDVED